MLLSDVRPKIYVGKMMVDNLSPNGEVFFLDEGHKYYHKDDIVDGKLVDFEASKYKFRSPTGILEEFKEYFDTPLQAKKYVKKHKLDITWEELAAQWKKKGDDASEEGTELHGFGESLLNGWGMDRPNLKKAKMVEEVCDYLDSKFELVRTELLVYSLKMRLAGQVDILFRDGEDLHIYDYKFLKEPLNKKSYYNRFTRKYKFMKGPFRRLMDTKYWHYAIQLAIYQWLMGSMGEKVKSRVLVVVTPDEIIYEKMPRIKIYTKGGILHAAYRLYNNKIYYSHQDPEYMEDPYKLIS